MGEKRESEGVNSLPFILLGGLLTLLAADADGCYHKCLEHLGGVSLLNSWRIQATKVGNNGAETRAVLLLGGSRQSTSGTGGSSCRLARSDD